jgi:hypothetical protein
MEVNHLHPPVLSVFLIRRELPGIKPQQPLSQGRGTLNAGLPPLARRRGWDEGYFKSGMLPSIFFIKY